MKKIIAILVLFFGITSIFSQEKIHKYTNTEYLFSVENNDVKFDYPIEEEVGNIKVYCFFDNQFKVSVQPLQNMELSKNLQLAVLTAGKKVKIKSKTFNENRYYAQIEDKKGNIIKMIEINNVGQYTYTLLVNNPNSFKEGINILTSFNVLNN